MDYKKSKLKEHVLMDYFDNNRRSHHHHHQNRSSSEMMMTYRLSNKTRTHSEALGLKPLTSTSRKRKSTDIYHDTQHTHKNSREEKKSHDYFNTLPDEMLLPILSWLPKSSLCNLSQVNKRFSRLIQDESLWSRVDLMGKILEQSHLTKLLGRRPIVLRLARAMIHNNNNNINMMMLFPMQQLTHLDLSMSIISKEILGNLLEKCPKLKKLSLEHLEVDGRVLGGAFPVFAHSIDTLNLTMCYFVEDYYSTAKALASFFNTTKRLTNLNLGCVKCNWSESDLTEIVGSLPSTLEMLNLSGFRSSMTDAHTKMIVERSGGLLDLDLSDCQELTGDSIESILLLKDLQHLGLSRCYSIDPPTYTLLREMKNLKYLELFTLFKEASLKSLTASIPGIEINIFPFSSVARPTVGNKRSSIWGVRVRDYH